MRRVFRCPSQNRRRPHRRSPSAHADDFFLKKNHAEGERIAQLSSALGLQSERAAELEEEVATMELGLADARHVVMAYILMASTYSWLADARHVVMAYIVMA